MTRDAEVALSRAYAWAKERNFEGFDPYDALRSPFLDRTRRLLGRSAGIAFTQVLRRLPWNVRPFLGIRPGLNPKAVALFLSAASRAGWLDEIPSLAERLWRARSPDRSHPCWGYNFPWTSRTLDLPPGTPTVVVTSFCGQAFLDAFEATGDSGYLTTAEQSTRFLLEDLHRFQDSTGICLSYSPFDRSHVYNASLLGAHLLCRVASATGCPEFKSAATPLVSFVLARQAADGSWPYGDARHQRWTDSFHTGFVLCALEAVRRSTGDPSVESALRRGTDFYGRRFFGTSGEPYYTPDRRFPLDIHSAAQAIVTFLTLRDSYPGGLLIAKKVAEWMMRNLLRSDGAFRYQIGRTHRVSIPYMRWSQAWGVRALAELVATRGVGS